MVFIGTFVFREHEEKKLQIMEFTSQNALC